MSDNPRRQTVKKHPRGNGSGELALALVAFLAGFLLGTFGPGEMQFESGVIAAAKGTHIATRVDLPDGTTKWHVSRTTPGDTTP